MNTEFNSFDNACISGKLEVVLAGLAGGELTAGQLNTALRHAAYYTGPSQDVRERIIESLIDAGAVVDWHDRGGETILNAIHTGNQYVVKIILNASDGDLSQLAKVKMQMEKKHSPVPEWAFDFLQRSEIGPIHLGF